MISTIKTFGITVIRKKFKCTRLQAIKIHTMLVDSWHKTNPVQYTGKKNALHLINALKDNCITSEE